MRSVAILIFITLCTTFSASASRYKLDEASVASAFESSVDITMQMGVMNFGSGLNTPTGLVLDDSMDKQTIAAIIAFAEWVLGIGILIPIHRIYLGCSGEELKVVVLYCITLGGCGLLPLIDGVMLLLDDTESRYIENPKYLMWID